jgi:hypothetical protein
VPFTVTVTVISPRPRLGANVGIWINNLQPLKRRCDTCSLAAILVATYRDDLFQNPSPFRAAALSTLSQKLLFF